LAVDEKIRKSRVGASKTLLRYHDTDILPGTCRSVKYPTGASAKISVGVPKVVWSPPMLLRALDRTSHQPFRCDVALKRLQAGVQLCRLFIDGRISSQWTIELGPLM
jgi:hypothetical protein